MNLDTNISINIEENVDIIEVSPLQEQSLLGRMEDLEAARAEAECLLQAKEQQLQEAWGEVEELREVIGRIEAELLELQRENEGLLRRQQGKEREREREVGEGIEGESAGL